MPGQEISRSTAQARRGLHERRRRRLGHSTSQIPPQTYSRHRGLGLPLNPSIPHNGAGCPEEGERTASFVDPREQYHCSFPSIQHHITPPRNRFFRSPARNHLRLFPHQQKEQDLSERKAPIHLSSKFPTNTYLPKSIMEDSTKQLYIIGIGVLGLIIFIVFAAWLARTMVHRYRISHPRGERGERGEGFA